MGQIMLRTRGETIVKVLLFAVAAIAFAGVTYLVWFE